MSGAPQPEVAVLVRLVSTRIDRDEVLDFVRLPAAGAIVTFTGSVRDTARGRAVVELEYEAYEAMAIAWLEKLARTIRERFAAQRVAVAHRLGVVPVGEDSVVIAVSAAHRAEAFDACRAIIEGLKADVPIWKRERYEGGEVWVGWGS